jgi:hypothetical protein
MSLIRSFWLSKAFVNKLAKKDADLFLFSCQSRHRLDMYSGSRGTASERFQYSPDPSLDFRFMVARSNKSE